jgi:hypothetical protein
MAPKGKKTQNQGIIRGKLGFYLAGPTRLELATSGVTGQRSNQTELRPRRRNTIIILKSRTFNIFPFIEIISFSVIYEAIRMADKEFSCQSQAKRAWRDSTLKKGNRLLFFKRKDCRASLAMTIINVKK